eukprot:5312416-Alexandrium_andersonii.AAC.1
MQMTSPGSQWQCFQLSRPPAWKTPELGNVVEGSEGASFAPNRRGKGRLAGLRDHAPVFLVDVFDVGGPRAE